MISEKRTNADVINFSTVLDELALIYVLKQEVEKQTEGLDIKVDDSGAESEEDDKKATLDNIMLRKKTLVEAEQMGEVRMVKEMLEKQKTTD